MPHWYPGSTAFWLAPRSRDVKAGQWPWPYTVRRDLPVCIDHVWYHNGIEVLAFNYTTSPADGHVMGYRGDHPNGFISDEDLGWATFRRSGGYLGAKFYDELRAKRLRKEVEREQERRRIEEMKRPLIQRLFRQTKRKLALA